MRYIRRNKLADGKTVWRFDPPKDAVLAGVVTSKVWEDGRTARYEAPRLIELVDKFRAGEIEGVNINELSTVNVVIVWWESLVRLSRGRRVLIRSIRKDIGHRAIKHLNKDYMQGVYNQWLKDYAINHCNSKLNTLIVMMDFVVSQGVLKSHSLHSVEKLKAEPYKNVTPEWTHEIASDFVAKCMEDVNTANLGVLAVLIAHTLQKPGVVKELKWDSVDFDNNTITCGRATITMSDELRHLMEQQHARWGHQRWVVPSYSNYDRIPKPYPRLFEHSNRIFSSLGKTPLSLENLRDLYIHKHAQAGVSPGVIAGMTGMSLERVIKFYDGLNLSKHLDTSIIKFERSTVTPAAEEDS